MLCSVWAALLQLAVVLRLATKVRGRGTEGGSGHREAQGPGQETHGRPQRTACGTGWGTLEPGDWS